MIQPATGDVRYIDFLSESCAPGLGKLDPKSLEWMFGPICGRGVVTGNGKLYFPPLSLEWLDSQQSSDCNWGQVYFDLLNSLMRREIGTPVSFLLTFSLVYDVQAQTLSCIVEQDPSMDGAGDFGGIAMAGNGKLYCPPLEGDSVAVIDPRGDGDIRFIPGAGRGSQRNKWWGITSDADGWLYCAPARARFVLVIDPINDRLHRIWDDSVFDHCGAVRYEFEDEDGDIDYLHDAEAGDIHCWSGIACASNGKLFCAPQDASAILVIDARTWGLSYIDLHVEGAQRSNKWAGIVSAEDGFLYCAPWCMDQILVIDPIHQSQAYIHLFDVDPERDAYMWCGIAASHGHVWCAPDRAHEVLRLKTARRCHVRVLGSSVPLLSISALEWNEFEEAVEQAGVPICHQHPHNFDRSSDFVCLAQKGYVFELVDHELWLLLSMLPAEVRPTKELDLLQEVKLRAGCIPKARLRQGKSSPTLLDISDTIVSPEILKAVTSNELFTPSPSQFHQGRAGVRGTLHRITGIWGLPEGGGHGSDFESAREFLLDVGAEIGRSAEQLQPFISRIVDEEWYDTVEALRAISAERWSSMHIPGRFVDAINRRLGGSAATALTEELSGLTLRVGRAKYGLCDGIEDVLQRYTSTLLVGPPGVGKSTFLREMTRVHSDWLGKSTVVVDTTSELGGFGKIPHHALGSNDLTRLEVKTRDKLFQVMLDAVQNHSAQTVVIDEIRDREEVQAAKTIANQGVVLLATAHGTSLNELVRNPTLNPLIGGVESVAIGDFKMREMNSRSKFVEQRREQPAFQTIIEISELGILHVHEDVALAVDNILRGRDSDARVVNISGDQRASNAATSADTGSTESNTSIDVLRPGISKVPATLMAKLYCGAAFLCCFDGSEKSREGGGGSCVFRICTDGRKNEHLDDFDKQVFLPSATPTFAEYAGMLSGVVTFSERLEEFTTLPKLFLLEGDNKIVLEHVRRGLESREHDFKIEDSPGLQPIHDEIVKILSVLDGQGVKVCIRHRPRRFNKVADQLAKLARQQQRSNFQHVLLTGTV